MGYTAYGIVWAVRSADLIRNARLQAGYSQAELARRTGSSQAAVARRENGGEEPTLPVLRRLLYACGLQLVLGATPLPKSAPRRRLLARREQILAAAGRRQASNVRLFGSYARGEERRGSDVDLLVDLPEELARGEALLQLLGLGEELRELTGLPVNVVSAPLLRPEVRRSALREAVPL